MRRMIVFTLGVLAGVIVARSFALEVPDKDCYTLGGEEPHPHAIYTGDVNVTSSGRPCQPWGNIRDSEFQAHFSHYFAPPVTPESLGNLCRDAAGKGFIFCYIDTRLLAWQSCNVPECNASAVGFSDTILSGQDTTFMDHPELQDEGIMSDPLRMWPEVEPQKKPFSRSGGDVIRPGLDWWCVLLASAMAAVCLALV